MKEAFKEAIIELIKSALDSFTHWLTGFSYNFALIGGTVCVLLYIAGWSKGMRCVGILVVAHAVLRTIVG